MIEKALILKPDQVQSILKGETTRLLVLSGTSLKRPYLIFSVGVHYWVREPWAIEDDIIHYKPAHNFSGKYRSTVHMPRACSRLVIEVTKINQVPLRGISASELERNHLHNYKQKPKDLVNVIDFKIVSVSGRVGKSYPSPSENTKSSNHA